MSKETSNEASKEALKETAPAGTPPQGLQTRGGLTVDLWCNHVAGGWHPDQLESGLGGSEECITLWAQALAELGHRVRVYHNAPEGRRRRNGFDRDAGMRYLSHEDFDPYAPRDVLVSWKSPHPWRVGAVARRKIHWSSDVEALWPRTMVAQLDAFVTLTPYHRGTMPWLPEEISQVIPHGIDVAQLNRAKAGRIHGRMIYASSPDRGLARLLKDWPRMRESHPGLTLAVYYGWQRFLDCTRGNPRAAEYLTQLQRLLDQEGIENRGLVDRNEMARAYWEAQYWALPLIRAESELFCLNAVKAMHCGATAVVNRVGALRDTTTRWIDYENFISGTNTVSQADEAAAMDWAGVTERYWEPIFRDD